MLLFGYYNGVGIYLIDVLYFYDCLGSLYYDINLFVYIDNVLCFVLLGWVGVEMVSGFDLFWCFDVVYVYDWYVGLVPVYLVVCGCLVKLVFIVYNLVY